MLVVDVFKDIEKHVREKYPSQSDARKAIVGILFARSECKITRDEKNALRWTRLSCHAFLHNAVRLQLHALAYNLANFLRTLALPADVEHWSLTTLREKLVKIGARVVRHGRYVVFQLAEVALPRALFAEIMRRIDRLKPEPLPA